MQYRDCIFFVLLTCSQLTFARASPEINYLPGTTPLMRFYDLDGVNFSGYLDVSYNYLSESNHFTSGVPDRTYDTNENGVSLQALSITLARQPQDGFGALLNTTLGMNSYYNSAYGANPLFDSQNFALDFQQLFVQYAHQGLTLSAGKYNALLGYESTYAPYNTIVSSSLIATFLQPTTFTGIKANYQINPDLTFEADINDGWNNVTDWSRRKTIETGVSYTGQSYSLSAYLTNGQERAFSYTSSGPIGVRNAFDFIVSKTLTDTITLVANYDYLTQNTAALPQNRIGKAVMTGMAGYIQYQFKPKWLFTVRGEFFDDPNGYATGVRQNIKEITLTLGYSLF